jgi:hypothetical protein
LGGIVGAVKRQTLKKELVHCVSEDLRKRAARVTSGEQSSSSALSTQH